MPDSGLHDLYGQTQIWMLRMGRGDRHHISLGQTIAKFLKTHDLDLVCRAHQVVSEFCAQNDV